MPTYVCSESSWSLSPKQAMAAPITIPHSMQSTQAGSESGRYGVHQRPY